MKNRVIIILPILLGLTSVLFHFYGIDVVRHASHLLSNPLSNMGLNAKKARKENAADQHKTTSEPLEALWINEAIAADDDEWLASMFELWNLKADQTYSYESEGSIKTDTPLLKAAGLGHIKVLKFMLDSGVSVDTASKATLRACDHPEALRLILKYHPNLNLRDNGALSAASGSCDGKGYVESVKILLSHGADPNIGSPLVSAAIFGSPEIIEVLLSGGANIQQRMDDEPKYNALCAAAKTGRFENFVTLLKHGADVTAPCSKQENLLQAIINMPNGFRADESAVIELGKKQILELMTELISGKNSGSDTDQEQNSSDRDAEISQYNLCEEAHKQAYTVCCSVWCALDPHFDISRGRYSDEVVRREHKAKQAANECYSKAMSSCPTAYLYEGRIRASGWICKCS